MNIFKKIIEELKPDLIITESPTMTHIGMLDEFPIEEWEEDFKNQSEN